MKIGEIEAWEAFQAVAMHGNFSRAANALRIGVPQLSKRVARLEEGLGIKLFNRSTRVVALTDEGKSLLPRVRNVLEDLSAIESSFDSGKPLTGVIRITSVQFLAHRLLIPVIEDFRKKHPGVRIEMDVSDRLVGLIESNFDLGLRVHDEPEDSNLIYRKLGPNELVFCASPAYLKRCPNPIKTPDDLRHHEVLVLEAHKHLNFQGTTGSLGELIKNQSFTCDNAWFLTQLALNGTGVLARSYWDVHEHLQRGELVQVLKRHPLENFGDFYVVIPSRKFVAPRIRAFLDFIIQETPNWIKAPRRNK